MEILSRMSRFLRCAVLLHCATVYFHVDEEVTYN